MTIWTYLGITPTRFQTEYVETGLVDVAVHREFPLEMFTYGRDAVHENFWDDIVRKCRGVIYRTDTEEIIARPFEKFFNLGTSEMPETNPTTWADFGTFAEPWMLSSPEVWEKMDGFLATMYSWNGQAYLASKGSFDSPHAKWATAWFRSQPRVLTLIPGYTPVFEGISSNFRIVVNYEGCERLVLLAMVNNETGEELDRISLNQLAEKNNWSTPAQYDMTWQKASMKSLDPEAVNIEGYVLVWRRPGQTPFRLKVKYVDYLRLHRMISHVSPKAIFNCLSGAEYKGDLNEWIDESTPWFSKYVAKWVRSLTARHDELLMKAMATYNEIREVNRIKVGQRPYANLGEERKAYALEFSKYPEIEGILFAMLDGKNEFERAWKLVKPMTKGCGPSVSQSLLR
jgi:RNA ligase